ncbi:MAG: twin-arginine translocation pathway signal protein, partial [Actinobacteria bacterium]|nr:twin-arginine translocation pathway signal protein [Actinomycetota bacterium]
ISGAGIDSDPARTFGPIYFAQYTLHRGTLKVTGQLAPIDGVPGVTVSLETRAPDGTWTPRGQADIDRLARTARFRIEGWDARQPAGYRLRTT